MNDSEHSAKRWLVLANSALVFVVAVGYGQMHVTTEANDILAELQLSLADWGTLWSAISFGALVTSILGGALGDRFGARRVIAVGLVVMGGTLVLRGTATDFEQLYLWMFLFGVALALPFTNVPKALGLWFPQEELGLANGVVQAGYGLGGGLALLATPMLLAQLGGWREVSYLMGVLTLLIALIWFCTVPKRATSAETQPSLGMGALSRIFKVKDLWIVALCNLLMMGTFLGIMGYLPTYLQNEREMSPTAAGFVGSLVLWSYIGGALLLPALSDRVGLRRIVVGPAIAVAGVCILLAAQLTGPLLWITAVLWGVTAGAAPLAFVIPLEMKGIGAAMAGSAIGIVVTAGYAGGWLSPIIGMGLAESQPLAGFIFWSGCYLVAACLFALVKETGPKAKNL